LKKRSRLTKSSTIFTPIWQAKALAAALVVTIFLNSCSDPSSVGIELAPGNNQVGVFFVDFGLPAEVVLLDSFNTTNQSILVVGEEQDDYFGKTSGMGFTRLFINAVEERPESEAILDSMFFNLDVVSVNGQDLENPKFYSVHRLTEQLQDTLYYNFNELSFEENPIASSEIEFGETKDTTLMIPVTEAFAEELFGKMKRGTEFNNLFTFREYFPGVAIKAREGDNTTIGVNLGFETGITTFFHYPGDTVATTYEISTASSRSFNSVKSDRSGTPTAVVTERQVAYKTGGIVGAKANLGMVIRLNTEPIEEFLDTLSGVIFNQVIFEFDEIESYPEDQNPLFSGYLYFTDESNNFIFNGEELLPLAVQRTGQPQIGEDENGNLVPINIAPAQMLLNPSRTSYSTDISSHFNAIFRGQIPRRDWIFYGGTFFRRSSGNDDFKRSFRQFKVRDNNIKVRVIYSKIR
jgi:hypothetical protein